MRRRELGASVEKPEAVGGQRRLETVGLDGPDRQGENATSAVGGMTELKVAEIDA